MIMTTAANIPVTASSSTTLSWRPPFHKCMNTKHCPDSSITSTLLRLSYRMSSKKHCDISFTSHMPHFHNPIMIIKRRSPWLPCKDSSASLFDDLWPPSGLRQPRLPWTDAENGCELSWQYGKSCHGFPQLRYIKSGIFRPRKLGGIEEEIVFELDVREAVLYTSAMHYSTSHTWRLTSSYTARQAELNGLPA